MNDSALIIAGKEFKSRFFLGTGKFKNKKDLANSIESSGSELVTVALRRIDLERTKIISLNIFLKILLS